MKYFANPIKKGKTIKRKRNVTVTFFLNVSADVTIERSERLLI